jgi:hypothetical protein
MTYSLDMEMKYGTFTKEYKKKRPNFLGRQTRDTILGVVHRHKYTAKGFKYANKSVKK